MADAMVSGQLLHTEDIDSLFEKYSVKELRDVEKTVRREIEKKKEDIRQMVGERYRDLIEAADTIAEMKQSIYNVSRHVSSMEEQCKLLEKKDFSSKNQFINEKKQFNSYYALAAQIKLLLDIPAEIWCLMESNQFLRSAELFLLAKHVHSNIQLESKIGVSVSSWFPVVSRQWITTSHFKSTIVEACKNCTKNPEVSPENLVQCFSALIILNNLNVRTVFEEFLQARFECIKELFLPNKEDSSIKNQICKTVKLIIGSLQLVYYLFLKDEDGSRGLLEKQLNSVFNSQNSLGDLSKSFSIPIADLTKSISAFNLILPQKPEELDDQFLQEKCTQWLIEVKNQINFNVSAVIKFVTTVKGLAIIRDVVCEIINENKREWDSTCSKLLQNDFHLWKDSFQPIFVKQIEEIVESQMKNVFEEIHNKLTDILVHKNDKNFALERDVSSYLWTENVNDFPKTISTSKVIQNSGNLGLKARGFTPLPQNLCSNLENNLKSLLDDVNYYNKGGLNDANDCISSFLKSSTNCEIDRLLKFCEKNLNDESGNFNFDVDAEKFLTKYLFLTRFLVALTELCPALQECAKGKSQNLSTKDNSDDVSWNKVKKLLVDESHVLLRRWKEIIVNKAREDLDKITTEMDVGEFLFKLPHWDSVTIQEENEVGKLVSSTIRIPAQVSWNLLKILHFVCSEMNAAGGHFLPRPIIQEIQVNIVEITLECYEKNLPKNISQVWALQLIFDLNFISTLTSVKDDKALNERIYKMTEFLESFVDPFDLDVFTPYIQTNLKLCVHRSAVLFGALVNSSKINFFSSVKRTSTNQNEQHDILSLNPSISRFSLLPLASNFEQDETASGAILKNVASKQEISSKTGLSKKLMLY